MARGLAHSLCWYTLAQGVVLSVIMWVFSLVLGLDSSHFIKVFPLSEFRKCNFVSRLKAVSKVYFRKHLDSFEGGNSVRTFKSQWQQPRLY